ncbi:unnamed protein product, partial [Discosporangium mesarthrocarpum]
MEHYRRRLRGAEAVTFSVEKVATGLIRLCARLFSRPGLAPILTPALEWLVPPHTRPRVWRALAGHVDAGLLLLVNSLASGPPVASSLGPGVGKDQGEEAWLGPLIQVLSACPRAGQDGLDWVG